MSNFMPSWPWHGQAVVTEVLSWSPSGWELDWRPAAVTIWVGPCSLGHLGQPVSGSLMVLLKCSGPGSLETVCLSADF